MEGEKGVNIYGGREGGQYIWEERRGGTLSVQKEANLSNPTAVCVRTRTRTRTRARSEVYH